jgi:pantothenate kinase type III
MRVLLLDVGNTRVRAALATEAGQRLRPGCLDGPESLLPLQRLGEIPTAAGAADAGAWLADLVGRHAPDAAAGVSVVPALEPALAAACPGLALVGPGAALPFRLEVEDPAAVGPDRLANVAAAAAAGLTDALVVDVGTATTFDVLRAGAFTGGLIAPGPGFAAEQLGLRGARLHPVPFGPVPLEPGRSTASAMAAGAWHVGIEGIRAVALRLAAAEGGLRVVITGGLGVHLQDLGFHDQDWTLRGALACCSPDR